MDQTFENSAHTDGTDFICFITQSQWHAVYNSLPPHLRMLDRETVAGKKGFVLLRLGVVLFSPTILEDGDQGLVVKTARELQSAGYVSTFKPEPQKSELFKKLMAVCIELWHDKEPSADQFVCGEFAYRMVLGDFHIQGTKYIGNLKMDTTLSGFIVSIRNSAHPDDPKFNRDIDIYEFAFKVPE